jgi:hypothetical protein
VFEDMILQIFSTYISLASSDLDLLSIHFERTKRDPLHRSGYASRTTHA